MKLQTQRLIIRELKMSDLDILMKILNNLTITRNLAVVPYPITIEGEKKFLSNCIKESKNKDRKEYPLAITLKEKDEIIGIISLTNFRQETKSAEMGYWLGEEYWNKGIMSEATKVMLEFGFNQLNLNRIWAKIFIDNEASKRTAEKAGFKVEGIMRKAGYSKASKEIKDEYLLAILKSDWKK